MGGGREGVFIFRTLLVHALFHCVLVVGCRGVFERLAEALRCHDARYSFRIFRSRSPEFFGRVVLLSTKAAKASKEIFGGRL